MWPRQHHRLWNNGGSVYDLGSAVGDGGREWSCGSNHISFWFKLQDCKMNHTHPPFYWFRYNHASLKCVLFNSLSSISHVIACRNCFENLKLRECDFMTLKVWWLTAHILPLIPLHTPSQLSDSSIVEPPWPEIWSFKVSVENSLSCQCSSGDLSTQWFTVAVTSDMEMSNLLLVESHFVVLMTCFQQSS